MIQLKDLVPSSTSIDHVPLDIQASLRELFAKLVRLELGSKVRFICTSGLRTMADHLRIYAEINAKRVKQGLPELNIPMSSKHLIGQAADIYDPKGELKQWCLANVSKLEEIGVWCEDFASTKTWVHFQTRPPKSGNRFFKP